MTAIVYGLFDPDECEIRYVGKTIHNEQARLDAGAIVNPRCGLRFSFVER